MLVIRPETFVNVETGRGGGPAQQYFRPLSGAGPSSLQMPFVAGFPWGGCSAAGVLAGARAGADAAGSWLFSDRLSLCRVPPATLGAAGNEPGEAEIARPDELPAANARDGSRPARLTPVSSRPAIRRLLVLILAPIGICVGESGPQTIAACQTAVKRGRLTENPRPYWRQILAIPADDVDDHIGRARGVDDRQLPDLLERVPQVDLG